MTSMFLSTWFWLGVLVWELGQQVKLVQAKNLNPGVNFNGDAGKNVQGTEVTTEKENNGKNLTSNCVVWERSRPEHSLVKPYYENFVTDAWTIRDWTFGGSTVVTDKFIRLTPDAPHHFGHLWNSVPVDMNEWEVALELAIHGKMGGEYGDGIVFWYVRDPFHSPAFFQPPNDKFVGVAVTVQVYRNHSYATSCVDAMLNNGTQSYHLDRGGRHTYTGDGCEVKVRERDGPNNDLTNNQKYRLNGDSNNFRLRIRYQGNILTVFLGNELNDNLERPYWVHCLTVKGVYLPTHYYFGLSASTSSVSDNHDVISVKTLAIDEMNCHHPTPTPTHGSKQEEGGRAEPLLDEPWRGQESTSQFSFTVIALTFICFFVIVTAYAGCWPQTPV